MRPYQGMAKRSTASTTTSQWITRGKSRSRRQATRALSIRWSAC